MTNQNIQAHAQAVAELEGTGNYRVLRRFMPVDVYKETVTPEEEAKAKHVCVIDTETTGLDPQTDKILEIGYLLATFNPATGEIYRVIRRYDGFEDPGEPISPEITKLTGIRDEDVKGKAFDEQRILDDIGSADIVLAQNAPFDRNFLERRMPAFAHKWWACTQREAPWQSMGVGSSKLEFLAYAVGGIFYEAHRALTDAEVLLHLLTFPAHDGRKVLAHVLESSRKTSHRIWAIGSPFDKKDYLKKRKYQWNDGSDPLKPIKAWYKDGLHDMTAELDDLAVNVYGRPATVIVDRITGRERFTERFAERSELAIPLADASTPATPPLVLPATPPAGVAENPLA